MSIEKGVIDRINTLIEQGKPISPVGKKGHALFVEEEHIIAGWLTSAFHTVKLVVGSFPNAYTDQCIAVKAKYDVSDIERHRSGTKKSECVGEMVSVLENLLVDVEAGLISSLEDRVRAIAFDDFLEHAEHYYNEGRKESGVIAGVVFEDTLRSIGKKNDITASSLEDIINDLVKIDVLTQVKAKLAKVASHVRTKATHAQYDEFELNEVRITIDFTRELISTHLDA